MTHPFEVRGLGRAPFKLVGVRVCEPMDKCDFCGKAIRYRFDCRGADGKDFGVGRDCVNKVEPAHSPLRAEVEKAAKEQEQAALAVRVQSLRDKLAADPAFLQNGPHPMIGNKTLRDYAEFVLEHGGQSAFKKLCAMAERFATTGAISPKRKRRKWR